jgi:hypothetical protein
MIEVAKKVVRFENGWSVSAITGGGSYSDESTFEVAVIGPDGRINYDHRRHGLDNVKGWATFQDVADICARVEKIPKEGGGHDPFHDCMPKGSNWTMRIVDK